MVGIMIEIARLAQIERQLGVVCPRNAELDGPPLSSQEALEIVSELATLRATVAKQQAVVDEARIVSHWYYNHFRTQPCQERIDNMTRLRTALDALDKAEK